jgi:iron-sulfur cluster assembly accessory protein
MIQLTEAAADALHSAMTGVSKPVAGLRLMARSRGCAGLQYQMGLVDLAETGDVACESRGVKILIDPSSVALLSGTTIDFIESEDSTGFSFDNPQAKCGSGCNGSCAS